MLNHHVAGGCHSNHGQQLQPFSVIVLPPPPPAYDACTATPSTGADWCGERVNPSISQSQYCLAPNYHLLRASFDSGRPPLTISSLRGDDVSTTGYFTREDRCCCKACFMCFRILVLLLFLFFIPPIVLRVLSDRMSRTG